MQKSEGGGISGGGSPTGLMSAHGAADFLTRTTAILAALFVGMAIFIAAYSTISKRPRELDESLKRSAPAAPVGAPLAGGTTAPVTSTSANTSVVETPVTTTEPAVAASKLPEKAKTAEASPSQGGANKIARKAETVVKQVSKESAAKPIVPKPVVIKPVSAPAPTPAAPVVDAAPVTAAP
jgi:preprotein translocase subunit SecG